MTNYTIPLLPVALVEDIDSVHNDIDTNSTDLELYEPEMRDNFPNRRRIERSCNDVINKRESCCVGVEIAGMSFATRRYDNFILPYKACKPSCFLPNGEQRMLQLTSVANKWRLFIDPSMANLKAVPPNNGNTKPYVPVAHAVCLKRHISQWSSF